MSMEIPAAGEVEDDQDLAAIEPDDLTDDELEAAIESEGEAEAVSYQGTDFDAEGLVRRLNRQDIVIPSFGHGDEEVELAAFQRSFVWTRPQMDRFIESLLLGFPVPGIMLVQQSDKRYLVLDGQQRLRTLQAFYNGMHRKREFSLENVAGEFKGLTYTTLEPEQKRVLDNSFIQATIVKTDGTAESRESVYQIFERLNSGGTQLTPHEIRIALYPGQFVDFLGELNEIESWRNIYGSVSPRVRDHELLLRVVALYVSSEEYFRPLKRFLNTFLGRHRSMSKLPAEDIRRHFTKAIIALDEAGAREYLRPPRARLNVATFDAVMVGAMRRAASTGSISADDVRVALDLLRANSEFTEATSAQTDTEENVRNRLRIATAAFA
ncbi:DUF262 domain-containing protein [Kocuria turfanensis]|uniref:DUF262 domain-containing protein n=1 Tax=Kocuria turfanensis TaxID=388357 RepID=UPI00403584E6